MADLIKVNSPVPSRRFEFNWGGYYSDIPGWIKSAIVAGIASGATNIVVGLEAHDFGPGWQPLVMAAGAVVIGWLAQFIPASGKPDPKMQPFVRPMTPHSADDGPDLGDFENGEPPRQMR
jgi:hypothetical protein